MGRKISELIDRDRVLIPLEADSKEEVIEQLTRFLTRIIGREEIYDQLLKGIWKRERDISTGIGRGVAIPHTELDLDIEPAAVLAVSRDGVEFDALDSSPVHTVFLLVCSSREGEVRLGILSGLSRLFSDRSIREELRFADSADQVVDIIRKSEGIE